MLWYLSLCNSREETFDDSEKNPKQTQRIKAFTHSRSESLKRTLMSTSSWRCEVVFGVENAYSNQTLFSALMLALLIPKMALGIVIFFHGNAILSL